MTVTTIPTAGIANDAVDNTKLDLASNYSFTGTITGTPQGLTLINSTSSTSTVASFSIDNVFSSTYKFYRVYMRVEYSQNSGYYMRMLQSDGSERTANYYLVDEGNATDGTSFSGSSGNVSTFYIGRHSGGNVAGGGNRGGHFIMDFYDPFSSSVTHYFGRQIGYHDSNGKYTAVVQTGFNTNAESHRGFKVVGNSTPNIIQHDVKVYGVTNA
jgi:hypothetical protein